MKIFNFLGVAALSAVLVKTDVISVDYYDNSQNNNFAHVRVSANETILKELKNFDYDCSLTNSKSNIQGVITIKNQADFIQNQTQFLSIAHKCPHSFIHVHSIKLLENNLDSNNNNGEQIQLLSWNTKFEDFTQIHPDETVEIEVVVTSDPAFIPASKRATAKMKQINDKSQAKFHTLVEKELHVERNRRRRNLGVKIKDIAEDIGDILFDDGLVKEQSHTINKSFNEQKTILDSTQTCSNGNGDAFLTLTEKIDIYANGQFQAEFGHHYKIVLNFLWLEIQDHYTWITHSADLNVGMDLAFTARFENTYSWRWEKGFGPFDIPGIANFGPKVELGFVLSGVLDASLSGSITSGFSYPKTTVKFDDLGDLFDIKEIFPNAIVTLPNIVLEGKVQATANATFSLSINANLAITIPLKHKKKPFKIIEGEIGVTVSAGIGLNSGAQGSGNAGLSTDLTIDAKGSLNWWLYVDLVLALQSYYEGTILNHNLVNKRQFLWGNTQRLVSITGQASGDAGIDLRTGQTYGNGSFQNNVVITPYNVSQAWNSLVTEASAAIKALADEIVTNVKTDLKAWVQNKTQTLLNELEQKLNEMFPIISKIENAFQSESVKTDLKVQATNATVKFSNLNMANSWQNFMFSINNEIEALLQAAVGSVPDVKNEIETLISSFRKISSDTYNVIKELENILSSSLAQTENSQSKTLRRRSLIRPNLRRQRERRASNFLSISCQSSSN